MMTETDNMLTVSIGGKHRRTYPVTIRGLRAARAYIGRSLPGNAELICVSMGGMDMWEALYDALRYLPYEGRVSPKDAAVSLRGFNRAFEAQREQQRIRRGHNQG
ncbi:hypothetical protein CR162_15300 [Pseudoroseomonas rhizosphaerae]|uniref:Uncharacterized protein n=2 Tax=Teichococcus rhizosphaerae TaxID=1335062 RepID=A0A2C7ABU9_9PROT|nr:hypothetical protein CR162_15300 [Pseudoroseomonas rhizosphaerae]